MLLDQHLLIQLLLLWPAIQALQHLLQRAYQPLLQRPAQQQAQPQHWFHQYQQQQQQQQGSPDLTAVLSQPLQQRDSALPAPAAAAAAAQPQPQPPAQAALLLLLLLPLLLPPLVLLLLAAVKALPVAAAAAGMHSLQNPGVRWPCGLNPDPTTSAP
jgi:hypothetical protein